MPPPPAAPGGRRRPSSSSSSSLPIPPGGRSAARRGAAGAFGAPLAAGGRPPLRGYGFDDDYYVDEGEGGGEEEEMNGGEGAGGAAALDPVDLYCTRFVGKMAVTLAAGVVGTGMGLALSASAFHRPAAFALGGLGLGLFLSLLKNDFGDLFRALGLLVIYLLERQRQAGQAYSALGQLRPMVRLAPRRPFPPVENPWAYVRASPSDIEFSMTKTLVAVVFVGALYGYLLSNFLSLFFLPAWLLALAGGGVGGYTATLRDGRGDMIRCLGMKLVAFFGLIKAVEEELSVWRKLGKVFHISYGHAARFDERWKVRERLWRVGGWVSGKLTREAERVRGDRMEGEGGREGGGGVGGGYPGGGFEQPTYEGEQDRWQGGGGGGGGGGGRAGGRPPPVNPSWGQR